MSMNLKVRPYDDAAMKAGLNRVVASGQSFVGQRELFYG
jgi:hypothetical protein